MNTLIRRIAPAFMILLLCAPGLSQMQGSGGVAPGDISIVERLGAEVALDIPLRDENGQVGTLRQYVDKPTVLMFNYFRCPGICPVLINSVVDVVNRMDLAPGKDYRILAVSFDPTDSPGLAREKKANYLNQMRRPFSPDNWRFLTGNAENTKAVADSAGFKYRLRGDMYEHPGALIVLTPKGVVSRYIYGTSFVPADVAMAISEAGRGEVRPTISKMLSFCYTYDPAGRGYVFSVTRFIGAATLVVAAVFLFFVIKGRSKGRGEKERG